MTIVRASDGVHWQMWIDTTLVSQEIPWAVTGIKVLAGLESWWADQTIPPHTYSNLQWNQGGTWNSFAGTDAKDVRYQMFGNWFLQSQNAWTAGQSPAYAGSNPPC